MSNNSNSSIKPNISLSEFVKLENTGSVSINEFIEIICQYLETDFKFDYITHCKSNNSSIVASDLVIHKADLVILLTGNQIIQLYESLKQASPTNALIELRNRIDNCIFNLFHIPHSILNTLCTDTESTNTNKEH